MNLVIDIGNTLVKSALVDDSGVHRLQSSEHPEPGVWLDMIRKNRVKRVIICTVRAPDPALVAGFPEELTVLEMSPELKLPVKNRYKSPDTLGNDRLALLCGASGFFKTPQNILVISAGTCITYDHLNNKNEFHGGSISPGIDLRLRAMHEFTARLPLPVRKGMAPLTGRKTEEALLSGALLGAVFEVNGFIEAYRKQYSRLKVLLTGGDAKYLEPYLKYKTFAAPQLLLEGLNKILERNAT